MWKRSEAPSREISIGALADHVISEEHSADEERLICAESLARNGEEVCRADEGRSIFQATRDLSYILSAKIHVGM